MKKLLFTGFLLALLSGHAQAQTVPQYCNASAQYDTGVLGTTKLVSAPTIGAIFVCGFTFVSSATATIGVGLTYSTPGVVNSSGLGGNLLVTQAVQTKLTPAFQFISPTSLQVLVDHQPSYDGIFVPPGNQLNITTSLATGPIQAIVYYWTQNP